MYNYDFYGGNDGLVDGGGFNFDVYSPYGSLPGPVAALVGIFGSLFLLYMVVVWIFNSIGLYHLAKDRGIHHAWFAWVPILYWYIIARLINNKVVMGDSLVTTHAEFFLPLMRLLAAVFRLHALAWSPIFEALIWVYTTMGLFRLFKIYRPKSRVSFTILSLIFGSGFFIFAIRNDRPFDPLEPDKVYHNFYVQRGYIEKQYEQQKSEIKDLADAEVDHLRAEEEKELQTEGISEERKQRIQNEYQEAQNRIRTEEHQDIDQLYDERYESIDKLNDIYTQKSADDAGKVVEDYTVKSQAHFDEDLDHIERLAEEERINVRRRSVPVQEETINSDVYVEEEPDITEKLNEMFDETDQNKE